MAQVFAGKRQRCIGILREVKNKWERRTPLIPSDVSTLTKQGVRVLVQPSSHRIFKDHEFKKAGAELVEDLSSANMIFGVKEFPLERLEEKRSYMIFSHTIKAQPYNMPFLDACLQKKVRLFDYETIRATQQNGGQRLVAFGKFAGYAGMIDCLRGVGERLLSLGYSTPFMGVASSYMYPDLPTAKLAVKRAGEEIATHGLPEQIAPYRFVFTGTGNVAKGAREIFELMPHKYVSVEELATLPHDPHVLYGCVIEAKDMVEPLDPSKQFNKKEYYENPTLYRPVFHEKIAPHTNVLVNCMYWDTRFPRLLTLDQGRALEESYLSDPRRRTFTAVADITCDIEGSVEFLKRPCTIDHPFFMYDPITDELSQDIEGRGILMMGVDNLPAEFPKDASQHFSQALSKFALPLAESDTSKPFADAHSYLPPEVYNSCITADGALTPPFQYISSLRAAHAHSAATAQPAGVSSADGGESVDVMLEGHLFDTGFINQALDLFEEHGKDFDIVQWVISPNRAERANNVSRAVIRVAVDSKEQLDQLFDSVRILANKMPMAAAKLALLKYDNKTKTYSGVIDERNNTTISFKADPRVAPKPAASPASFASGPTPTSGPLTSTPKPKGRSAGAGKPHKILVLGSGFVAGPLVEYLTRRSDNVITVASAAEAEAKRLVKLFQKSGEGSTPQVTALHVQASDKARVRQLIAAHDIVVSLLPATLHADVAKQCIELKKNMVTASYVSPAMQSLHDSAQHAGITILNEIGLDPGLDHMACMRLIDSAKEKGQKVVSFKSLCGGLPAPECATNPFAYKFSWSPLGMLLATQNNAVWREDGKHIDLPASKLLLSARTLNFNPAFNLEYYANRDSLSYTSVYGIPDVETMFRGTIRYAGTARLLHGYAVLGLIDRTPIQLPADGSWEALMCNLFNATPNKLRETIAERLRASGDFNHPNDIQRVVSSMEWLGLLSASQPLLRSSSSVSSTPSVMELLCAILQEKLSYAPGERDLVVMYHEFLLADSKGRRSVATSSLVSYGGDDAVTNPNPLIVNTAGGGGKKGFSAMSRTVGLPAAIGVQMILDGKLRSGQGVIRPIKKDVYEPVLKEMEEKEGVKFIEEEKILA